jgi:predicted nucleic acid-binding protein
MALRGLLLVDANVLVDYLAAGVELLGLVARAVGPIHVVSTVLAEVEDFDADGCARVGIRVVEPTLAQAREAAEPAGRLSFADRLCLVVCRERGWVCVSNDKALRRACEAARVDVCGVSSCSSNW